MKCVIRKNSDIQIKTVEKEMRSGGDIFLIPIDVLVCSGCGERYYDRKAMRRIEETGSRIKEKSLDPEEVGRVLRVHAA